MSVLDPLLADGVIDEILGRLKSGKEADIWLVRRAQTILAAKVYKDRDRRSFKNNADYKEGRAVRNSRTQRAIDSGSSFGREAEEQAWKTAEADALQVLHAGGARVPRPIQFIEGVLLMEVVIGADGEPARRLIDVASLSGRAMEMYRDLRGQIIRMLCAEIIHGDLSAYNILDAAGGPTIIDFPQMVSPSHNSRAEYFFLRDFQNVFQFLGSHDRAVLAFEDDGRKIWSAYARRHLTPDFRPTPPGSEPQGAGSGNDRRGPAPQHAKHPSRPSEPPRPPRSQKVPSWQPPPVPLQSPRRPQPPQPPPQRRAEDRPPQPQREQDTRQSQPPRGHDTRHPQPPRGHDTRPPQPPRGHDTRPPQPPRGHDTRPPQPPRGRDTRPPQPSRGQDSTSGQSGAPPQHPDARAPNDGQPGQGRRRRRRRRRGGGGGQGPNPQNAGGGPGNAPRPPHGTPRPQHGAPRGGEKPGSAPGEPKLPGWLVSASKKKGGSSAPRARHPNEQKPFRRRKRRF